MNKSRMKRSATPVPSLTHTPWVSFKRGLGLVGILLLLGFVECEASTAQKRAEQEPAHYPNSSTKPRKVSKRTHSEVLVAIGSVGQFRWHCGRGRELISLRADRMSATNEVSVFQGSKKVESRLLHPGHHLAVRLRSDQILTWRITQGTEPRTLSAQVAIDSSLREGCLTYLPPRFELDFDSKSHDISVMPKEKD
jgi:hypothetical protein